MPDTITFANAKVTLPCGPWQETHEFTGDVRIVMPGEVVLAVDGTPYAFKERSDTVWPILRKKQPQWQPPEYARGTGWTVEPIMKSAWIIECGDTFACHFAFNGVVNPVFAAAGWTIPPERKVYVC